MEAAEIFDDTCNQGIDPFRVANVALIELRLNPQGYKLGNRLRSCLDVAIAAHRDVGTCRGISKCNAFADTACPASDQCHPPAQVKICHPLRLL